MTIKRGDWLGQQFEINCSFNYTIHVLFYVNVIGGNNEATNHSRLMAIKPAHFCNCLINMPILEFLVPRVVILYRKNFRDLLQLLTTAICIFNFDRLTSKHGGPRPQRLTRINKNKFKKHAMVKLLLLLPLLHIVNAISMSSD